MNQLIAAYENPSAPLNDDTIGATSAALEQTFGWLQALCGWEPETLKIPCPEGTRCHVCQGLDPASGAFTSLSDPDNDNARELSRTISGIEGFATVRRTCPGFGEVTTPASENGGLKIVIGFTSAGIDPVWGGELVDCKLLIDGVETVVAGSIAFSFGRSFFLDQILAQEPIIRFTGTLESAGRVQNISTNLRVSLAEGIDVAGAFEVPNVGSMVYFSGRSGQGIDAQNGRFACDFEGPPEQPLRCRNAETGEAVP